MGLYQGQFSLLLSQFQKNNHQLSNRGGNLFCWIDCKNNLIQKTTTPMNTVGTGFTEQIVDQKE